MKIKNLINPDERHVHVGSRTVVIAQDIVLLHAEINYTLLFLANGQKIVVSCNLGKLQDRLIVHKTFIRLNRKTIVNSNFVTNYNKDSLKINGTIVKISRRRKDIISLHFKNSENL